jgi:hypothetical protein
LDKDMANMHGGKREGAGRKPGSLNKRTLALRDLSEEAFTAGVLPLEVMLRNMRFYDKEVGRLKRLLRRSDPAAAQSIRHEINKACLLSQRFAVLAAPYVHPKLSPVSASVRECPPWCPLEAPQSTSAEETRKAHRSNRTIN